MADNALILLLVNGVGVLFGAGGVVAWFKLGPERRQTSTETQSTIFEDLNSAYVRVCDELLQSQMRLKACEAENESCRRQLQDLQTAVGTLKSDVGRQYRLFLLARARAHLASKTLGNYELHIDFLLEEMRSHKVPITPMMRTTRIRNAYNGQLEKLEEMEAQELEKVLKEEESPAE